MYFYVFRNCCSILHLMWTNHIVLLHILCSSLFAFLGFLLAHMGSRSDFENELYSWDWRIHFTSTRLQCINSVVMYTSRKKLCSTNTSIIALDHIRQEERVKKLTRCDWDIIGGTHCYSLAICKQLDRFDLFRTGSVHISSFFTLDLVPKNQSELQEEQCMVSIL
jgi:hypothetical protein